MPFCSFFINFAAVMEQKKITFDSFIRSVMAVIIVVGIVMLLNRLSSVLLPFFLAWLISFFFPWSNSSSTVAVSSSAL
jgi:predicted PurR-regulated permease PerM